jgi:hypothetical protein
MTGDRLDLCVRRLVEADVCGVLPAKGRELGALHVRVRAGRVGQTRRAADHGSEEADPQ